MVFLLCQPAASGTLKINWHMMATDPGQVLQHCLPYVRDLKKCIGHPGKWMQCDLLWFQFGQLHKWLMLRQVLQSFLLCQHEPWAAGQAARLAVLADDHDCCRLTDKSCG